jgi:hypothetical protein
MPFVKVVSLHLLQAVASTLWISFIYLVPAFSYTGTQHSIYRRALYYVPHISFVLSLLEFNLEDQKQATYKMFGPDTDYSLIDEGKQCGICLFVCLSIC